MTLPIKKYSSPKSTQKKFTFKAPYKNKWLHFYNSSWFKFREKFLEKNKRCYVCGEWASDVDHIEPHKGDKHLFMRQDNHLPLCHSCHSFVTSSFDSPGKSGKMEWISMKKNNEYRVFVIGYDWSNWISDVSSYEKSFSCEDQSFQ